ncbi:hypothetical protein BAUCODRAFT_146943 [Baudoinia panamericana UAMH 10762]|uniref:Uncharacterized protein n=1 Tax=Baudoinia panamericana (strain UAMH 10762) TaxID=717646 RepID=M2NGH4_BAUPA|nr:uncharacterized protein BAUCODRAFT_146943 [Baudoinia panamericana UAMH 10762]EMC98414.1 hypothetical protein BAUCODRAFT_146943 [Baudoinia panamericana UAMH 10762]
MAYTRSLCALLAVLTIVGAGHAGNRHAHHAEEVRKRQILPPEVSASTSTTSPGVIAYITPSPGANPVAITAQSQLVTYYVPQYTLCPLAQSDFFAPTRTPISRPTTAPFHNYSSSIPPGSTSCSTIYSQATNTICDTTLRDLITSYPVTECSQDITFSTREGYRLITPTLTANISTNTTSTNGTAMITPTPTFSIQNLTTYYFAPWQNLTGGTAPPDITKAICADYTNGTECITEYEVWHTSVITETRTATQSLDITTRIPGPSSVVIWETIVANVTEIMTTFSTTTTSELEYETSWTVTHTRAASFSTAPTVFETFTVEQVSPATTPTVSGESTTTVHLTITTHVGTMTVTLQPGESAPGTYIRS